MTGWLQLYDAALQGEVVSEGSIWAGVPAKPLGHRAAADYRRAIDDLWAIRPAKLEELGYAPDAGDGGLELSAPDDVVLNIDTSHDVSICHSLCKASPSEFLRLTYHSLPPVYQFDDLPVNPISRAEDHCRTQSAPAGPLPGTTSPERRARWQPSHGMSKVVLKIWPSPIVNPEDFMLQVLAGVELLDLGGYEPASPLQQSPLQRSPLQGSPTGDTRPLVDMAQLHSLAPAQPAPLHRPAASPTSQGSAGGAWSQSERSGGGGSTPSTSLRQLLTSQGSGLSRDSRDGGGRPLPAPRNQLNFQRSSGGGCSFRTQSHSPTKAHDRRSGDSGSGASQRQLQGRL